MRWRPGPRISLLTGLLGAAAIGLSGCGGGSAPQAAPPGPAGQAPAPVQVVASTDVWGSVAQAVGGDRVAVTSIIDNPSKDPHEYESTPEDATAVGNAGLLLRNGGGYDDFMTKLIDSSGNKAPVVDAVTVSGLQKPGEPEFNEHVWYSLPTVQKVAQAVAADLGRIDPSGASTYTANAQRFTGEIDQLTGKAEAIGSAHPRARVVVTEPVPDYLLETAKLTNVTPEEFTEAIEEGNDPPAAVVQETLGLFRGRPPVEALVLNAQTQTPVTDQVRQAATAARVPEVDVTETLAEGKSDYVSWMGSQIDALAKAVDT